MNQHDIIIIGGGPNGLCGAYELSKTFPQKRILVVEKNKILNNLRQFPDVLWHSTMKELKFPSYLNSGIEDAYNPISSELVKYYEHFTKEHRLNIVEQCEVTNIQQAPGNQGYELETRQNGQVVKFQSKIVILCTGIYENNRKLQINSEFDYVSHRFDLKTTGKNLLLVGGGNSATDYIIHLLPKNKITWVMRSPAWTTVNEVLAEQFQQAMNRHPDRLTIHYSTTIQELRPNRSAVLSNGAVVENIDECTLLLGFNSKNPLFEKIGLEFDHECLKLGAGYETNKKNIYAFGSIMAKWDGNAPRPTFIHNGNPKQLNEIINHIIEKEVKDILHANGPRTKRGLGSTAPVDIGFLGKVKLGLKRIISG